MVILKYDTRDKNEITKPQLWGKCSVDLQGGGEFISKQTWLCVLNKNEKYKGVAKWGRRQGWWMQLPVTWRCLMMNHLRWLKKFPKVKCFFRNYYLDAEFNFFTLFSFFFKTLLRSFWDEVKFFFVLHVFISFRPSFVRAGSVHIVQSWSSGNDTADRRYFIRDTVA